MLNGLQILRAFAAYAVVAFHVFEFLHSNPGFQAGRFPVGRLGVDLFFVISGFIMVYTTKAGETPLRFAIKRATRILPLYWAATALAVAVAILLPWALPKANLSAESIVKSFLFIPHPDAAGGLEPVLFVGWTLNFEMMFYLLFSVSLFLPARLRIAGIIAMMLAVMALGYTVWAGTPGAFYGQLILLDFVAGCLLAVLVRMKPVEAFARRVPVWPIMPVAVIGLYMADRSGLAYDIRTVMNGAMAALLVFAVALHDLYRTPVTHPVLKSLGDSSYSAYLLHPFVVAIGGALITRLLGASPLVAGLIIIAVFAGTAIAATLSYMVWERPSNRVLRGLILPRKAPAAGQPAE